MKKIVFLTFIVLIVVVVMLCLMAPVSRDARGQLLVKTSIPIEASDTEVFLYLGHSEHASDWSVYVHHISLLSGVDGHEGCVRRCFKEANETGVQWDERILVVDSFKLRRLNIYNAKGFPIYNEGLMTEQWYRPSGRNVELSLVLILPENADFMARIKFYFAAFKINSIFKDNLQNIKKEIEKQ